MNSVFHNNCQRQSILDLSGRTKAPPVSSNSWAQTIIRYKMLSSDTDTGWKPLIFNSAPAANGFCITKSPRNLGCVKITLLCVLGSGWMLTPHFIVGVLLTELRLRPQQLLVMTLLRSEVYIPPARKIVSFPDPNPRPRLPAAVMVWDTGARSPGPFCTAKQRQRSLSTCPTTHIISTAVTQK